MSFIVTSLTNADTESVSQQLQYTIAAERLARVAVQGTTTSALTSETTSRQAADQVLQTAITAETTRSLAAESAIAASIATETTRATAAETLVTNNLISEIDRAIVREEGLGSDILFESMRTTTLEGNLASEVTRATAAEAALTSSITTNVTTTNTQVTNLSTTVTDYITTSQSQLQTNAINTYGGASTLTIAGSNTVNTLNMATGSGVQTVNIGTGSGVTTINIGAAGDTVAIAGTLTNITTTNTNVTDSNITLNKGGTAGSAGGSGLNFEENGAVTGYIVASSDRNTIDMKAPNSSTIIQLNQPLLTTSNPTFGTVTANLAGNAATSSSTTGNAATVTNGVYTTDIATVTNTMLAGSIASSKLANSAVANLSGINTGDQTNITGNAATVTTIPALSGEVSNIGNAVTLTNTSVINKTLTGFSSSAGTVTSADTILTALQKVNANQITGNPSAYYYYTADSNGVSQTIPNGVGTYINFGTVRSNSFGSNLTATSNLFTNASGKTLWLTISTCVRTDSTASCLFNMWIDTVGGLYDNTMYGQVAMTKGATIQASTICSTIEVPASSSFRVGFYQTSGANLVIGGPFTPLSSVITISNAGGIKGDTGATGATPVFTGDVTTSGNAATVALVGGSTASNVNAATVLANAATNLNTASQIVKRDASGNFTAGTITAALSGNASTVTTIPTLSGEVTNVGNAVTLTNASVTGKLLTGYTGVAGTIATTDTILTAINKLNGNIAANAGTLGTATSAATASTLMLRDANADVTVRDVNVRRVRSALYAAPILDCDTGGGVNSLNTLVGYLAGNQSISASLGQNVCVGRMAGNALTVGYMNTFTGSSCGSAATGGYNNCGYGYQSLPSLTTANSNSAYGLNTLPVLTVGSSNIAFGMNAGYNITTGNSNTCIGGGAGLGISSTNNNTFLGFSTSGTAGITNSTALGSGAVVTTSNSFQLGDANVTKVNTSGSIVSAGSITGQRIIAAPSYAFRSFNWGTSSYQNVIIAPIPSYLQTISYASSSSINDMTLGANNVVITVAGTYRVSYRLKFLITNDGVGGVGQSDKLQSSVELNNVEIPMLHGRFSDTILNGLSAKLSATGILALVVGDQISFPLVTLNSGSPQVNAGFADGYFEIRRIV
jgi:hypothetical protein